MYINFVWRQPQNLQKILKWIIYLLHIPEIIRMDYLGAFFFGISDFVKYIASY